MYSRIAIFLLFVTFACIAIRVGAQQTTPATGPQPPPPENVPRPLPPPPGTHNLPPDPVKPMPKTLPGDCGPAQHWGPGGCVDGAPEMGVTEINGIPYAEANAIYERHKEELESIPGVIGVGLSVDGIIVTVSPGHWNIPTQVEGLLVITRPPPELWGMGHTESQTIRPLHGGVLFGTPQTEALTPPKADCTMTTMVLAHGDPWLITAGHCMTPNACPQSNTPSNCPSGTPLWQCQRYSTSTPNLLLYQPASPGALPANVVGWVQRYVVQGGTAQSPISDVAAAALDDNTVDRDRSLATHFNKSAEIDQVLEGYGLFNGQRGLPIQGSHVTVVTGNIGSQGVDVKSAHTYAYGQPEQYGVGGGGACPQAIQSYVTNQIELTMDNSQSYIKGGDSGSPIVDDGGLPYWLWVCETNAQAQCISQLLPSLSVHLNAGEVRYFTVLAQGQGQAVTYDPYYHRVFFRIRQGLNNPTGTLVGAAGLSITTS